ncbi:MAG: thioredoxin family protein [Niabella sp.]
MKKLSFLILIICISISLFAQHAGGYAIGDAVQSFSLKNIDGQNVSLTDYKTAKGFIIVFTCNECPYARAYQDRIIALDKKFKPMGFPVLAINANYGNPADSYLKMTERAEEKGYTFPYLSDPGQQVTKQFGATNTPHTFIIAQNGKGFILRYAGAIDNDTENTNPQKVNYAEDAINALLADKEVVISKTKAVGCGIKWNKATQFSDQ